METQQTRQSGLKPKENEFTNQPPPEQYAQNTTAIATQVEEAAKTSKNSQNMLGKILSIFSFVFSMSIFNTFIATFVASVTALTYLIAYNKHILHENMLENIAAISAPIIASILVTIIEAVLCAKSIKKHKNEISKPEKRLIIVAYAVSILFNFIGTSVIQYIFMIELNYFPYLVYVLTLPVIVGIAATILIMLIIAQCYVHKKFLKNSIFRKLSNAGTAFYISSIMLIIAYFVCAEALIAELFKNFTF